MNTNPINVNNAGSSNLLGLNPVNQSVALNIAGLSQAERDLANNVSAPDYSGPLSSANSASDNYANLTRAQYNNYITNVVPNYQILLDAASSPQFVEDSVNRSAQAVDRTFGIAQGQQERNLNSYRINETQRQKQSRDESFGLSRAAATASAKNQTRFQAQDAQNVTLVGGLSSSLNNAGTN